MGCKHDDPCTPDGCPRVGENINDTSINLCGLGVWNQAVWLITCPQPPEVRVTGLHKIAYHFFLIFPPPAFHLFTHVGNV